MRTIYVYDINKPTIKMETITFRIDETRPKSTVPKKIHNHSAYISPIAHANSVVVAGIKVNDRCCRSDTPPYQLYGDTTHLLLTYVYYTNNH